MLQINNNGVTIPNECPCIWCGGTMKRKGANYMGAGTNSFTLWCEQCGAIQHHALNFERKIKSFKITYEFDEEGE